MRDVTLLADGFVDTRDAHVVFEPTLLIIREGVIQDRRPARQIPTDVTRAAPGAVLSPAFVDPHVHLAFVPCDDHGATTRATLALSPDERNDHMLASAAALVSGGVMTARDLGDVDYAVAETHHGEWPWGLHVEASGPPVTTAGGHLHWCVAPEEHERPLDQQVRQRQRAGVQWLKIMASGGQMTPSSEPLAPQFDTGMLQELTAEAHRCGLRTASHALNVDAIRGSADAGVTTIEHAVWRDASGAPAYHGDVLGTIHERGTALVWTFGGLARHELGLPGYDQLAIDPSVDAAGTSIDRYREALAVDAVLESGVLVGIGSDAGVRGTPFASFADVLTATSRLTGLSSGRIVGMATRDNARVLGVAAPGLDPGDAGNVVALQIRPQDVGDAFAVTDVWAGGQQVTSTYEVTL